MPRARRVPPAPTTPGLIDRRRRLLSGACGCEAPPALPAAVGNPSYHTNRAAFAHELTHVDAGERYDNTALFLLCSPALLGNGPRLKELVTNRVNALTELQALLPAEQGLYGDQRNLIATKLTYPTEKSVGVYATNYFAAGKIDVPTRDRLTAVDGITGSSGVLIEYDTVITQILVLLRLWDVAATTPFHARVLAVAQQQQQQRWAG